MAASLNHSRMVQETGQREGKTGCVEDLAGVAKKVGTGHGKIQAFLFNIPGASDEKDSRTVEMNRSAPWLLY